jgi:hypothetical protein
MNFREVVDAIAEKLLCDQCLALYRREPETKIGEFCPRLASTRWTTRSPRCSPN